MSLMAQNYWKRRRLQLLLMLKEMTKRTNRRRFSRARVLWIRPGRCGEWWDNFVLEGSLQTNEERIGHFRVPKPSLSKRGEVQTFHVKMSFICMRNKNYFHIKEFALSLVLKKRLKAPRKWLISYES